jgi:hypothetical protein
MLNPALLHIIYNLWIDWRKPRINVIIACIRQDSVQVLSEVAKSITSQLHGFFLLVFTSILHSHVVRCFEVRPRLLKVTCLSVSLGASVIPNAIKGALPLAFCAESNFINNLRVYNILRRQLWDLKSISNFFDMYSVHYVQSRSRKSHM